MIALLLAVTLAQAEPAPPDNTVTVPDDQPIGLVVERGAFTLLEEPTKFALVGKGVFFNALGYNELAEKTNGFQRRIKELEVENRSLDSALTKRLEEPRITVAVVIAVGVLALAAGAGAVVVLHR